MVYTYSTIIESILTTSIIWDAATTAKDKGRQQRIIRCAKKVISCNRMSLQDTKESRKD